MLKSSKPVVQKILKRIYLFCKSFFYEEILVLGDSHVWIFSNELFRTEFVGKYFNIIGVGGATVSGLENPNSVTQAMPIFQKNLKRSKAKICIVSLGEVDTGFVIWYRAQKYNTSVEKMFNVAVVNYTNFLKSISRKLRVICVSTPLPTIQDGQSWGEISNARKDVKATQKQRTDLTLKFNEEICKFCRENDMTFVSLDNHSLGENGIVKPELIHPDPNNHHYNPEVYSKMLIKELKKFVK